MDAFVQRLLDISLSGSVIILVVLALRQVLKRAPRRTICLLWVLAIARLLVPFEIVSDLSLQPAVGVADIPVVSGIWTAGDFFDSVPEDMITAGEGTQTGTPAITLEEEPGAVILPVESPLSAVVFENLGTLWTWLWLAGALGLGIYGLVSYVNLKRRVRGAVILEEGVWVSPTLDTAFVLGFFRPQIYLPLIGGRDREFVLAHERNHIRRLDHWWKLAAYAAVSLHWFNPLAWVAYILLCRDMEMACDEETVRHMDTSDRKAYSAALLSCAAKRSGIACPVAFGEIGVKGRIKNVLNYKRPGFWVTLVALVAAVAVGVCFLTSPLDLEYGYDLTDEQKELVEQCYKATQKLAKQDVYHIIRSTQCSGDDEHSEYDEYLRSGEDYFCYYTADYSPDFVWERWSVYNEGSLMEQDRKDGEEYPSDSGWQDLEYRQGEEYDPRETMTGWESLNVTDAQMEGEDIILTFSGEPLNYGEQETYTVDGYAIRFCFDEDGEVKDMIWTYGVVEDDGIHIGGTHVVMTFSLQDTHEDTIRQEIDAWYQAAQNGELRELNNLTRTAAWAEDIAYLTSVLLSEHPRLNSGSTVVSYFDLGTKKDAYTDAFYDEELKTETVARLEELTGRVGELTDDEILYELQAVLAELDDNFTFMKLNYGDAIPVVFEPIYTGDGVDLYATRILADYEELLYARLTAINGIPIGEVVERMLPYISHENEYWAMNRLTNMFGGGDLTRKDMLVAAGVCQPEDESVEMTMETDSGTLTVAMEFWTEEQHKSAERISVSLLHSDLPPYEYLTEKGYWYEVLKNDTLYIRLQDVDYTGDNTFDNFLQEAAAKLRDAAQPMKLVIDLRLGTGNYYPFSEVSSFINAVNRYGCREACILIDGNTNYMVTAVARLMRDHIDGAVLVGSPTGNGANCMIYHAWYTLPNSGYGFECPAGYQVTDPENGSSTLTPDVEIWQTLEDLENGVDTVLSYVLASGEPEDDAVTPTGYDLSAEEKALLDDAYDWFWGLSTQNVASVEVTVREGVEEAESCTLNGEEIAELIAILNEFVSETPIMDPETYYGGTTVTLTVTMTDGTVRQVVNVCGAYMTLDGVAFETYGNWLDRWSAI